jgi:glutathionylspermidine synthase
MIPNLRQAYNAAFTPEKYTAFLEDVYATYNHRPIFRISETPVFIPNALKKKLIQACDEVVNVLVQPDFKQKTENALQKEHRVPNEDAHTTFLVIDFGICENEKGELIPQLIELQGFPSLYFFQHTLAKMYRRHFDLPANSTTYLNGLDETSYVEVMREVIVGDTPPEQVVLLEIEPMKQATVIDFLATQKELGIKVLCITEVIKKNKKLYYKDENGNKIQILKIYNRVIFDELERRKDLKLNFNFMDELEVEWIGHPNWFFRISKYTMPFLKSEFIPETHFLKDFKGHYPTDLNHYVLKPLFSFSGQGVQLHVTKSDLDKIEDKGNYILQKKVQYKPALAAPNEPVKVEIRMLLVWKKNEAKPRLINNLIRLSKGEMIGVRYNKDKDWVGSSAGFFCDESQYITKKL